MQFKKNNLKKFLIGFLIIFVFFIWLWVLRFNTINSPLMRDEGEYAYAAQLLHDGGVPYKESFMQKPPMIIYTYYLAQRISEDVWVPRFLALVSLFLTALIMARILYKEYNLKTALVFLALFSPFISFSPLNSFFAQPEVFLLLPLAISLCCYFKWRNKQKNIYLIIMGAISAMAILFKPIIFFAILFLFFCVLFYKKDKDKINWKEIFYRGALFFIGGIISSIIILLPIILEGGFYYMWESAFLYNRYYAAISSFKFNFLFFIFTFFWPALLLCIWFFLKEFKNRFLFLGIFVSCLIGTAGSSQSHYYLIVIPILTIICAISIVDLIENMGSLKNKMYKNFVVIFFILILSFFFIFPFRERFLLNSQKIVNWTFATDFFNEAIVISNELKKITTENDQIFIFGNEPEILYYAHRKSMTRFVITYPILINTIMSEKYGEEVKRDFEVNPPEVIISGNILLNKKLLNKSCKDYSYSKYMVCTIMNDYYFVGQTYAKENEDYEFINYVNKNSKGDDTLSIYRMIKKN